MSRIAMKSPRHIIVKPSHDCLEELICSASRAKERPPRLPIVPARRLGIAFLPVIPVRSLSDSSGIRQVVLSGGSLISPFPSESPQLLSLATAVPGNLIEQTRAAQMARAFFGDRIPRYESLSRVFGSTGIERRYSVVSLDWFEESHDWPDRTGEYIAGASRLFEDVVLKALAAAKLDASEVDAVIPVSSPGVAPPSLEARVLPQLGFRSDVRRIPIFGLGCAGGGSGFATASRIAASEAGTTGVLGAVELGGV